MLVSFRVKNFLSIEDEVFIDFRASGGKDLPRNLLKYKKTRLLKSMGLYGANATGISNIIKAFYFVWELTKYSHSYNVDTKIRPTQFKLRDETLKEPSRFEITFTKNGSTYRYGFSCLDSKIIDEYLFRWDDSYDKPRRSVIFIRKNTNEFTFKSDVTKQELIRTQLTDNVLYLSKSTALNFEKVRDAYDFITSDLVITFDNLWSSWIDYTRATLANDSKLKRRVVGILQSCDLGGISDISIEKKKGKAVGFHANFSKDEPSIGPYPAFDTDTYVAKFLHRVPSGKMIAFSELEESAGTLKMYSILVPILDILEKGKILIIDELEASLHPNISELILRLFHSKMNRRNAQILFASHNTNLLSKGILRRDQILITRREPNKGTSISPLTDFKLREGADFERAYRTGRVGGLPFIDETVLE